MTTVVPYEPDGGELLPVGPSDDDGADDPDDLNTDRLHTLTRIEQIATGRYVLAADYAQSDELALATVRYFDRKLNVESPWGAD
ncbi:MAG: hypothetical protein K8F92_04360 [Hyphomicrobium sp.]|uniref:hypothetical protein n=1 Tax=Hyphomicrobium sp. TaxID=82 RepID=UPI001329C43A|nr:hypothetical protein [Hyphomicrobium sp.]KAB2943964.1 MAG: hypothetical protein F9K20_00630 [Hyphomicrobium sp.]MBZ0208872.1 hypothetical protein [Hyphomicrobium sp.]